MMCMGYTRIYVTRTESVQCVYGNSLHNVVIRSACLRWLLMFGPSGGISKGRSYTRRPHGSHDSTLKAPNQSFGVKKYNSLGIVGP